MGQSTYERDRDRRGFKELAKLAPPQSPMRSRAGSISGVSRSTTKDENDSGLVDLEVLASADPGAVDRASVTPLASTPLFDDDPTSQLPALVPGAFSSAKALSSAPAGVSAPSLPSLPSGRLSAPPAPPAARISAPAARISAPAVAAPAASVSAQAILRSSPKAEVTPRKSGAKGRVAAVIGLAAIAAGAFFVVRAVRAPSAPVAADAVNGASSSVAVANTPASGAQAASASAGATPAADRGVDPLTLPVQTTIVSRSASHPTRARHTAKAAAAKVEATDSAGANEEAQDDEPAPVAAKAAPAAAAAVKEAAPESPAPPAANDTLLGLMAQSATAPAVAAPATPVTGITAAAAPAGGSGLAPRPSQGQVTTALGGVLPAARACLGDDDDVSRAHVVFGSDGAVQSVSITGFAAGKPSEACIKTALGKAHVAAFAEASYGATVTVRP